MGSSEIQREKTTLPLIKSYIIETYRASNSKINRSLRPPDELQDMYQVQSVDDDIFELVGSTGTIGFVEQLSHRYWVLFATARSSTTDPLVNRLVTQLAASSCCA